MGALIILALVVFGGIALFAFCAQILPILWTKLVYYMLGGDKD